MKRSATRRLATIVMVVASLLYAQLALAQFVCPMEQPTQSVSMDMSPGMPCDMGHEQDSPDSQPALCHHHCTNAAQSFEPLKVPAVSLPAVVQVLVMPLRVEPQGVLAVAFATKGEAQPPPSPVFLSTLRLRV